MDKRLRQILRVVANHPRMAGVLVACYLLLALLGWWGSTPPPLGSIGTDAAEPSWRLPTLPVPGGTSPAFARLLSHPPWSQAPSVATQRRRGRRGKSRLPRGGPRVGTWSLVGIVNPESGASWALFLDPQGALHRALPGATLPGKARMISVGTDSIMVRLHGQNRLRRLYAPAPQTAAPARTAPAGKHAALPGH